MKKASKEIVGNENERLHANAVGFTSASASLVNAGNALNNMADGELFEM